MPTVAGRGAPAAPAREARRGRLSAAGLALACAAAGLLAACHARSTFGADPQGLFAIAPGDVPTKVVTAEIVCGRGRLVVDQATISAIERMPGVYAVRRGTGRNEVQVLVDESVRPESIAERLAPECRGRVVSVDRPAGP